MAEEKKSPEGLNVIVEADGDWVKTASGTLCLVAVVGDEAIKSCTYGSVNTRDAYAIIDAVARQIGAIAEKAGIGANAANAVVSDGIAKQMMLEKSERFIDGLGGILDKLDQCSADCAHCEDCSEPKSS